MLLARFPRGRVPVWYWVPFRSNRPGISVGGSGRSRLGEARGHGFARVPAKVKIARLPPTTVAPSTRILQISVASRIVGRSEFGSARKSDFAVDAEFRRRCIFVSVVRITRDFSASVSQGMLIRPVSARLG